MKFGFYLPTRGHTATPEALETLITRGEALGFHSVMIADHVVFPTEVHSKYPYTVSGAFPGHGDALEQLTLMAFVAAITTRLRLVTSVMILPLRLKHRCTMSPRLRRHRLDLQGGHSPAPRSR